MDASNLYMRAVHKMILLTVRWRSWQSIRNVLPWSGGRGIFAPVDTHWVAIDVSVEPHRHHDLLPNRQPSLQRNVEYFRGCVFCDIRQGNWHVVIATGDLDRWPVDDELTSVKWNDRSWNVAAEEDIDVAFESKFAVVVLVEIRFPMDVVMGRKNISWKPQPKKWNIT